MSELIERVMYALGWMPSERERVLEDALEMARSSHGEDRAALEACKRELIRVTASWEKAEARIRELERERDGTAALFGGRNLMVRAIANRKLQELHERADRIAQR